MELLKLTVEAPSGVRAACFVSFRRTTMHDDEGGALITADWCVDEGFHLSLSMEDLAQIFGALASDLGYLDQAG